MYLLVVFYYKRPVLLADCLFLPNKLYQGYMKQEYTIDPGIDNSIHYKVRTEPLFLDENNHRHFLTYGWCKITDVVRPEEIKSFIDAYGTICGMDGFKIENQFLNTGCLPNEKIRQITSVTINNNVQTILPRMFNMDKVAHHTGGSFVIKPPHKDSALAPHQDSSFIDETSNYSLFMWVPFCDVTDLNGAISVLPGSHLWGNTQRGFSTPWNLEKHVNLLTQYMHPVYANAGDVLIFDPALVHASAPNLSHDTRKAVTITVVKSNPDLIYYYKDNTMPADVIERFWVNEEFFRTYDFASKPDETKWRKDVIPYHSFDMSEEELVQLIEKHLPH